MDDLKVIDGLPYCVDKNGNVYSMRTKKYLKPIMTNCGYLQVRLWYENQCHHKSVHRLVAEAFIENPYKKEQVNHKDGIKTNNNAENLEWVTRSENQLHRYNVLWRRGHNPSTKEANRATSKKVLCIDTGEIFASITQAARSRGKAQSILSNHLMGRRKYFDGMEWRIL